MEKCEDPLIVDVARNKLENVRNARILTEDILNTSLISLYFHNRLARKRNESAKQKVHQDPWKGSRNNKGANEKFILRLT